MPPSEPASDPPTNAAPPSKNKNNLLMGIIATIVVIAIIGIDSHLHDEGISVLADEVTRLQDSIYYLEEKVNGNNPALDAGEPSHAHKDHERLDKQNLALIERIEALELRVIELESEKHRNLWPSSSSSTLVEPTDYFFATTDTADADAAPVTSSANAAPEGKPVSSNEPARDVSAARARPSLAAVPSETKGSQIIPDATSVAATGRAAARLRGAV